MPILPCRGRLGGIALALLLPLASPPPLPAAPPAVELTLERIFAGPALAGPGAAVGAWCPDEDGWWARWGDAEGGRALLAEDAATGTRTTLLRAADLEKDRPATPGGEPVPMTGIGRSGPRDLLFAPDGSGLVFAWQGDLHHLALPSRTRTRLTRTLAPISDVRLAPDGRKVSFAREHDLWVVAWGPEGVRETRVTREGDETTRNASLDWVYPEELDATTAAWWSPDATRIAFLRLDERRVHRHALAGPAAPGGLATSQFFPRPGEPNPVPSVGVATLDGTAPTWLDLGASDVYVPWVAWVPSAAGPRVLVAVLDRAQRRFEARLFAADGTPAGVLWAEEDPHWVDVPPAPRVLARGGDLLWRSRKDGFWRVYRQPSGGGEALALTPPAQEAGAVLAVDEAAGTLLHEAATPDRLRTILVRARLDGTGPPQVVLDGTWSHAVAASPSGRWLVDAASRATTPPETTLRRPDGSAVRVLARQTTPAHEALGLTPPEFLEVAADDGTPLTAMLWRPAGFDPARRHPVVVHVYGGPGSALVRDAWRGAGAYFAALLAREGFFVLVVDGRGTGGRGKAFETPVHRRLGTPEVADQAAAVRWLAAQPGVDGGRVGIWGWSYGGTMACLALARAPEVFRAAIAVAPVTDWRAYDSIYTERYLGTPGENPEGYAQADLVARAAQVRGALLLLHGLADDNVHVDHTLRLSRALVEARRPFDQMLYPGRGHGIEGSGEHLDVYRRLREHLRRHLAGDGLR